MKAGERKPPGRLTLTATTAASDRLHWESVGAEQCPRSRRLRRRAAEGRYWAATKRLKVQLDPGTHRVQLKTSGYQDSAEQPVEIVAKKEKPLSFTLREIQGQTYLKIESKPPGASVRIDDKAAGSTVGGRAFVGQSPRRIPHGAVDLGRL